MKGRWQWFTARWKSYRWPKKTLYGALAVLVLLIVIGIAVPGHKTTPAEERAKAAHATLVRREQAQRAQAGKSRKRREATAPTSPPRPVDSAAQAEHEMEAKERAKGDEVKPYAGLGAPKSTYIAHNNVTEGRTPHEPAPGSEEDRIEGLSSGGRVTKYQRLFHFQNAELSEREKLLLVGIGSNLPDDARIVREASTCMDWHSTILGKLIGKPYAQATTVRETSFDTMEAVSRVEC